MLKDTYIHNNEFDWYLKADDDTFVFMNNLRKFLKNKNSSVPIDFGYDLKIFGKNPLKNIWPQTYHSGGAGYVLSKEALNRIGSKLNENFEYCENTGSEDADVGRCLRRLNVDSCKSIDKLGRERFLPINILEFVSQMGPDRSSKWYYKWLYLFKGKKCCSDTLISFHYASMDQMKKLGGLANKSFNFTLEDVLNKIND